MTTKRDVPIYIPAMQATGQDTAEDESVDRRIKVGLLPNWSSKTATPDHFAVFRVDPPSGYIGDAPLEIDENGLRSRFGGRILRIELRTSDGQKLPGGNNSKMVSIDAEPIAPQSATSRTHHQIPQAEAAQWDRAESARQSAEERIALLKAEIESRAEREAQRIKADLERSRLDHQQNIAIMQQRAEDDRKRIEAEAERERIRAQSQREREQQQYTQQMQLMQAQNAANLQMLATQHTQTMEMFARMSMQTNQRDPLEALKVGVELATSLRSGAEGDEATQSFNKLLEVAKEGIVSLRNPRLQLPARTGQNAGKTQGNTSNQQPTKQPAKQPATSNEKRDRVKTKLAHVIRTLESKGHDVEALLDNMQSQLDEDEGPAAPDQEPTASTSDDPKAADASEVSLDAYTND